MKSGSEEDARFVHLDPLFEQVGLLDEDATLELFRPDLLATAAWNQATSVIEKAGLLPLLIEGSQRLWRVLLTEDPYLRRALEQQVAAAMFFDLLSNEDYYVPLTLAWSFCAVTLVVPDDLVEGGQDGFGEDYVL